MSKFIEKIKVPTEIPENEADRYHVLLVEASFNQTTLDTSYKARKQVYDDRSWEKVKGNLKQIGQANAYILHNPTIEAGGEATEKTGTENTTPTEKTGEQGDGPSKGTPTEKGPDQTGTENTTPTENGEPKLEDLNSKELKKLAKDLGFEGAMNQSNQVYIDFIKDAQENGENTPKEGEE